MKEQMKSKTFKVRKYCANCGGEMISDGKRYQTADEIKYDHDCNKCGMKGLYDISYPFNEKY